MGSKYVVIMKNQPQLAIPLTSTDKIMELGGVMAIVATWLLIWAHYSGLPNEIPTHFDMKGQADSFGSKDKLLWLPSIFTIIFAVLTLINRSPHWFNYPVKITPDNALEQYTGATKMVRYLKLVVALLVFYITWKTIAVAVGQADGLGIFMLPIVLALIVVPFFYFIAKSPAKKGLI
jgi:uncharacterized membrane protein